MLSLSINEWIEFLPINLIFAFISASFISRLIFKGIASLDTHLVKEKKEETTQWLLGRYYEGKWAYQFCLLCDRWYGEKPWSKKFIFRSCIASLFFVIFLYFIFKWLGFLEINTRAGNTMSFVRALGLGVVFNLVPDYLSLLETRWLLRLFQKITSIWAQIVLLAFDLIFSSLIIWVAITLYALGTHARVVTPAEMVGIFSIYSVFFYSTFFTSILAWVYAGSATIIWIFCKTPLKNILNIKTNPFRSIALVASILSFICIFVLSFAFSKTNVNDLWCTNFPSTCSGVYRLTEDKQKAFEYLSVVCEKGSEPEICERETNKYYLGDTSKTLALWTKSCESGLGTGCLNLGWMYLHGRGVEQNNMLAAEYFIKSCANGDARGCTRFLDLYIKEQNIENSLKLLSKACNEEKQLPCVTLGQMYETGRGVEPDFKEAVKLVTVHRGRLTSQ